MLNTDREYVRLCLDGHPEAFEQLVARYHAPLIGFICGRLRDREAAEEVAQEAFVRSYAALAGLRKPESYYAWLFGIADRAVKEYLSEKARARRGVVIAQEEARREEPSGDFDLDQAIASLPAPYREVVLLRYYGGLSCVEVAERLDVPLGTVTKRLSRAHEMLRKSLRTVDESLEHREARP
ncbi:MAG: sigma-70 family RNA polymerase sigma factor [Terracidiphilus sp.]